MSSRGKAERTAPIPEHVTLDQVMVMVNKQCGDRTMILGSQRKKDPPRIPFGVFSVDFCLGGGMPLWQSTCGWGPESGGKSLLGIKGMRSADLLCWKCFNPYAYCTCSGKPLRMRSSYLDVEGTFDMDWARCCGVDPNSYLLTIADYGEQYVDIAEKVLKADDCGLVVLDSLAALVPETELEASASDQFIGKQAAMIGRAVRKLKSVMLHEMKRDHPCAIYFVNQMRTKIGQLFGDPETMSGGFQMRHEFSLLLRLVKKSLSKGKDGKAGADAHYIDPDRAKERASRHSFSIRKEKVMTLSGVGEFVIVKENLPELEIPKGMIDDLSTLLTYAKEYGVVVADGREWKYLKYKAKTQEDIKRVWREKPEEYLRCSQVVIQRAKDRLRGEVTDGEPGV